MSLLVQLICSPWFWADVLLSISGGVVVAWGLRVEKRAEKMMPPTDFSEEKNAFADLIEKSKKEEERGWRILMTGIVMEVVAAFVISIISGLEIADANGKSSIATLEAKNAEKQTAEVISNNLVLQTNVKSLSFAVIKLARRYDLSTNALAEANARLSQIEIVAQNATTAIQNLNRHLTDDQKMQLFGTLLPFPKGKVSFMVPQNVPDGEILANDLAKAFLFDFWKIGHVERPSMISGMPDGVFIESSSNNQTLVNAIADTLNSFNIRTVATASLPVCPTCDIASSNDVEFVIMYKPEL